MVNTLALPEAAQLRSSSKQICFKPASDVTELRLLPAQNLNMLTVGAKDGKGGFFPEGIAGRIHTPEDFDKLADGTDDWEGKTEATQVTLRCCCCCCCCRCRQDISGIAETAHQAAHPSSSCWPSQNSRLVLCSHVLPLIHPAACVVSPCF